MSKDMENDHSTMITKLQAIVLTLRECHSELEAQYPECPENEYIDNAIMLLDESASSAAEVVDDLSRFQARKEGE